MNVVRRKVSLNKRRYKQDGFDLDLAYITERVIAMGFPAVGVEGFYRNPRSDVRKFLDFKHRGHYKVYNLCIEPARYYDSDVFDSRVSRFPFQDHQAPPLGMMAQFCSDVDTYLSEESTNVVAVHCKAGKGRAGMMICCYLIHSNACPSADESMLYYAKMRTYDMEGVTIPSQRRYIYYYDDIFHHGVIEAPTIRLSTIKVTTSQYAVPGKTDLWCQVLVRTHDEETQLFKSDPAALDSKDDVVIDCDNIKISGDIKIMFFDKHLEKKHEKEVFHLWFNTSFINNNQLILTKPEIDKAWSDKKNKKNSNRTSKLFSRSRIRKLVQCQNTRKVSLKKKRRAQKRNRRSLRNQKKRKRIMM